MERLVAGAALAFRQTIEEPPVTPQGEPRYTWARVVNAAKMAAPLPASTTSVTRSRRTLSVPASAHAVAELLGHADAALVLARYGHALPGEVASAGTVIDIPPTLQNRGLQVRVLSPL
jgi:hypothetical protein